MIAKLSESVTGRILVDTVAATHLTPEGIVYRLGPHAIDRMPERGWTSALIDDVIDSPARIQETIDDRWLTTGRRLRDPATAFFREDGNYVVRNDINGDIVEVSDITDPGWEFRQRP